MSNGHTYSDLELCSIYELGRLYFEMGYFAAAERIFNGLLCVDEGRTPARIAIGLIKLEKGFYEDAVNHFRKAVEQESFETQSKLGLAAAFIATGETQRAKSILVSLGQMLEKNRSSDGELRTFWEALVLRAEA